MSKEPANKEQMLSQVRDIPCPYKKIPLMEMIARYEQLYNGALIDIFQDTYNLHNQWLGPQVKCLSKNFELETVAGFAFTIQWVFDPQPDERERIAAKMVESYPEGSIVVVDTGADKTSGFWGELATTTCVNHGVRAAVINGGAKDTGFIRAMGWPIFAKFSSPVDGFHLSRLRGWQLPIWFDTVLVRPWDFLVCDADGCLVVPYEIAEDMLVKAEERKESENSTRALLKKGVPADEAARMTGRKDL
ncbi:MAG: RraA family protein [Sedimentisphaerales bacterium]|nr:RraA family protein [Sedimentisphaerales bacterium]